MQWTYKSRSESEWHSGLKSDKNYNLRLKSKTLIFQKTFILAFERKQLIVSSNLIFLHISFCEKWFHEIFGTLFANLRALCTRKEKKRTIENLIKTSMNINVEKLNNNKQFSVLLSNAMIKWSGSLPCGFWFCFSRVLWLFGASCAARIIL